MNNLNKGIEDIKVYVLAGNIANKIKKTYPKLNLFQLTTLENTILTEILDTLEKHEYVIDISKEKK